MSIGSIFWGIGRGCILCLGESGCGCGEGVGWRMRCVQRRTHLKLGFLRSALRLFEKRKENLESLIRQREE